MWHSFVPLPPLVAMTSYVSHYPPGLHFSGAPGHARFIRLSSVCLSVTRAIPITHLQLRVLS
jgi:hypothetical protein